MPEIARFYGIVIKIFFGDLPPAHFHAVYGEYLAMFDIDTLEVIEGDLPPRAKGLVTDWARLHQAALREMWKTQKFGKLPPLE